MKVMKYKYVYKMANKGKLFLLYSGSNLHINLLFWKIDKFCPKNSIFLTVWLLVLV